MPPASGTTCIRDDATATRLDLGTVDDDDCLQVIERLDQAGFEVAVWDTTSDVGIASFYCLIVDRRDERTPIPAPAPALTARAAWPCCARSLKPSRCAPPTSRARATTSTPTSFMAPAIEQKLRRARHPDGGRRAAARFSHVPSHDGESFADDLAWLLARLRAVGIEQVVAVDLTRPDFAIPVVRVVIPGLEGPDDHPRYLPGPRARAAGERRP